MAKIKVTLKPIVSVFNGVPTYGNEIDITNRVEFDSLSTYSISLVHDEFALGAAKTGSVKIVVNNKDGMFDGYGSIKSAMNKRDGSKIIFYLRNDYTDNICGSAVCGITSLEEYKPIFAGLIDEENIEESPFNEKISLTLLDAIQRFERIPFDKSQIKIGTSITALFLELIKLNPYIKFDDSMFDQVAKLDFNLIADPDDPTEVKGFESVDNVKDVLDEILKMWFLSLVPSLDGETVKLASLNVFDFGIAPFGGKYTNDADDDHTVELTEYNPGLARVYNFYSWDKNDFKVNTSDDKYGKISIEKYGFRPHEPFKIDFVPNESDARDVLQNYLNQTKDLRNEVTLTVTLDAYTQALNVGDEVELEFLREIEGERSEYGRGRYGNARYAAFKNNFELIGFFYVLEVKKDLKNFTITLKLKGQ